MKQDEMEKQRLKDTKTRLDRDKTCIENKKRININELGFPSTSMRAHPNCMHMHTTSMHTCA